MSPSDNRQVTYCMTRAHATHDFSSRIKIWWKICFDPNWILIQWSLQHFAHAMTALLSWHVQKFVVILLPEFELHQNKNPSSLNFDGKMLVKWSPDKDDFQQHLPITRICHSHHAHLRYKTSTSQHSWDTACVPCRVSLSKIEQIMLPGKLYGINICSHQHETDKLCFGIVITQHDRSHIHMSDITL